MNGPTLGDAAMATVGQAVPHPDVVFFDHTHTGVFVGATPAFVVMAAPFHGVNHVYRLTAAEAAELGRLLQDAASAQVQAEAMATAASDRGAFEPAMQVQ